jgi:hypothetical protein
VVNICSNTRQRERSHFPGFCNNPETNGLEYQAALMERDMNTAIARYLARSSEKTAGRFDGLVSVAIFSGVGLLISLELSPNFGDGRAGQAAAVMG